MVLLKYGKTPRNCIDLHIEVLEGKGICWFGKIGVAPSISVIREKIGDGDFKVLLYCQDEVYLCNCIDVVNEAPNEDYPNYYEKYLFGRGIFPKIYFCLNSIEQIDKKELTECVILSSRNSMLDTVRRSMASFFYVECADPKKEKVHEKEPERKKRRKKEVKTKVDINDCIYRENERCTNPRCISYEYECTRPSSCTKQKLS